MTSQVRKRFLQGFGANLYSRVVITVIQIIGVPVLLHAWGTQLYGEWLILFAIPSYLSLTDLGFSQSAGNDMCVKMVKGDERGALAVFQSLLVLVFSAMIVGIVIVSVVLWFLPISHWLHFVALSGGQARWLLWLLAVEVLVRLSGGICHAGFTASGEYGLHYTIHSTALLVQYAGIWCAALLGFGPVTAAMVYLILRVVASVSVPAVMLRRHPGLCYGVRHARFNELRHLTRPALANIAMPLAQAVSIQGMVLVVGAALGPLAVVVFATLRTVTRLALQGVVTVSQAMEPELAFAWGARDRPLVRKLYIADLGYSFWLSLAVAVALYFLGTLILEVWTHNKVHMNSLLFSWLLLSSVAGVFWYSGLVLRKAANLHLRAALWYVGASLATIVFAALLLHFTRRLADAGLALLLTDTLMAVYIMNTTKHLIGLPFGRIVAQMLDLRTLLRPVLAGVNRAR